MKGHITIIRADGTRTDEDHTAAPGLEYFQKIVGGYIERVPDFVAFEGRECFAYCDEEGKLKGKPTNEAATRAWEAGSPYPVFDVLVGDIAIISGDHEFMEAM